MKTKSKKTNEQQKKTTKGTEHLRSVGQYQTVNIHVMGIPLAWPDETGFPVLLFCSYLTRISFFLCKNSNRDPGMEETEEKQVA